MKLSIKCKDLFEIEKLRDKLAKNKLFKKFVETYSLKTNVKDLNTKSFWNKLTNKNKETFTSSPIYQNKINLVIKRVRNRTGRLLDIGFGNGDVEEKLRNLENLSLFGIDISDCAISNAKRSFRGTFKIGNIFKIPFRQSYFDIVLVLDVLEHLTGNKTFKAYTEITRVLKKNGELIISVPLNEGLEEMLGRGENPNGHMRDYTPDIIRAELTISGFKIFKETLLYAFKESYLLKSLVLNFLPFGIRKPNLMIVFAKKK